MRYFLIVANGKRRGLPIPVEQIDLFYVGTGPMCHMRMTPHEQVADQHCAFITRGKKLYVDALDADHPTYVNGDIIMEGVDWPLLLRRPA